MSTLIEGINSPKDLQCCTLKEIPQLDDEIRNAIIRFCTTHGGHLGSNLGAVELTIALHYVFDSPVDRIIFDVSHQCYTHKILTGRKAAFCDPTAYGSVSGFTCPSESPHDHFNLGHTGTSISLANGMALARSQAGQRHRIIAVIGDGSLSSGTAFEGLNCASQLEGQLIIVCNDNEMAIDENVGGLYANLAELRKTRGNGEHNIFKDLGFDYRYVEEGNDAVTLIRAFDAVKDLNHPVVMHIHTRKGLGIDNAKLPGLHEGHDHNNHWCNPITSINPSCAAESDQSNARRVYGSMAMESLLRRFNDDSSLMVISPATSGSNGILPEFQRAAGDHYLDVGIAEEHAISLACGIAAGGGKPIVATSSTFFQRSYDQIQQEMCLNGCAVTLLAFATGISGTDSSHSGAFDIPLLSNIPDLTCLAPTSGTQLLDMLTWASGPAKRPVLIRMPGEEVLAHERSKGIALAPDKAVDLWQHNDPPHANPLPESHPWSRYRMIHAGSDVALLGLGDAQILAMEVARLLRSTGKTAADTTQELNLSNPTIIDPQQYSTLDTMTLEQLRRRHRLVVTFEDSQLNGGWGQRICSYYAGTSMRVMPVGAEMRFTDRVTLPELKRLYGMDASSIVDNLQHIATL
jgi:1-deoxy-D-xylulose-5-phosphate synthase